MIVPAICAAAVAYFGYFTIWGERGLMALASARTQLDTEQQQLASVRTGRERLEHRIDLLRRGDADMVQEVLREKLLAHENGAVAIPRNDH